MSSGLVVIQANQLQKLSFLNQGSTRLRVECFDLCPTLIVLGANSGTVYILDHESLELKHQVPTGVGSVVQLSISPDESYVAYALSNGLVEVFEIPSLEGSGCRQLVTSKEHEGHVVSSIVWSQANNEIYIGDTTGRVSVLYVPKSKTAMFFRTSSIHLMTLDSGVTQLDYSENYLLVSTLTRSYICNTTLETFTQVGTKLRQGEYGGCFCRVYPSAAAPSGTPPTPRNTQDVNLEGSQATDNTLSGSGKFNLSDCYEAMEDEGKLEQVRYSQEKTISMPLNGITSRVFCARPGTRIWEVDHSGKVLVTHQLKRALLVPPADVLFTDGSMGENESLNRRQYATLDRKVKQNLDYNDDQNRPREDQDFDQEPGKSNPASVTHPPVSVAFTKLLSFYNSYLLAISTYGIYIIDPSNSKVLLWISVAEGVTDVKVSGNTLIYRMSTGSIQNLMITTVDIAVLVLHTKGLFNECAQLCLQYENIFRNSKLLYKLGVKILADLASQVKDELTKDRLENLKKLLTHEKDQTDLRNKLPDQNMSDMQENSYQSDVKQGLTSVFRMGHSAFLPSAVTRWYSEPYLGHVQNRVLSLSQATLSTESSPSHHTKGSRYTSSTASTFFTEAHSSLSLTQFSSEDTLQSASSGKSYSGLSMSSQFSGIGSSTPELAYNRRPSSPTLSSGRCSSQSGSNKVSLKSLDTSQELYEDPLFPPGEDSPELEMATRLFLDGKHGSYNAYDSHNFYSYAYAPIHPGSETAAILQDLMENVTTNVVDTITSGTKTLTEKLKNVGPLKPSGDRSPLPIKRDMLSQQQTVGKTFTDWEEHQSSGNDPDLDAFDTDIVIKTKTKKKGARPSSGSSPAISRSSTMQDAEEVLRPSMELPDVIRNLHDLVNSTLWQIQQTDDQEEALNLMTHWFDVYCSTIQQIQSRRSSPQSGEEVQGEGPISLSSVDSSFSYGSGGTCESLNWDSTDIGFEPSNMSADIIEQITELFIQCLLAGVHSEYLQNPKISSGIQKPDMIPHPLTPEEVRKMDSIYATLISNDCGLIRYSSVLNGLESLGQHSYVCTWAALLERVTKDFDTFITHPLPDIISDLDFTRSQRVAFLYKLASGGNMKNFIHAATRIDNPTVILDVVLILNYLSLRSPELDCTAARLHYQKQYLLQYLTEVSICKNLRKMYLDSWCRYPELQYDILNAIFSALNPGSFSCSCGMPLPRRRLLPLKDFVETILTYHIIDAKRIADLCQSFGYWDGFCSLSLQYSLQPTMKCLPYILQNCNLDILHDALELLQPTSYRSVFDSLTAITTENSSVIKCFRCQKSINLVSEAEASLEGSQSNFVYKFRVNGEPQFKDSVPESDTAWTETLYRSLESSGPSKEDLQKGELNSMNLKSHQESEEKTVLSVSQVWEAVIVQVLRRKGAAETMKLLQSVEEKIPAGIIPQKVYNWCILASLVDDKGLAVRWALLDTLSGAKNKPYSQKVSKLLHRGDTAATQSVQETVEDSMTPKLIPQQKQRHEPPGDESYFQDGARPLGHHWGVRSQVLQGICFCCHLKLPTEALVSEGGITVFPCGHSFHTICLLHRGHQCVICLQRTVQITNQYVQFDHKFI